MCRAHPASTIQPYRLLEEPKDKVIYLSYEVTNLIDFLEILVVSLLLHMSCFLDPQVDVSQVYDAWASDSFNKQARITDHSPTILFL